MKYSAHNVIVRYYEPKSIAKGALSSVYLSYMYRISIVEYNGK